MSRPRGKDCTIGVDVGTTAVKAVAVDGRGAVVARARVPHGVGTPSADFLEHHADRAWRKGPRKAYAAVAAELDGEAAAFEVTSMVPSITAVDRRGAPMLPGLLYGDARARDDAASRGPEDLGGERDEGRRMLEWAIAERPDARGYWPCQAVATYALSGVPAVDTATAASFGGLFVQNRWDPAALEVLGVGEDKLSRVVDMGRPAGTVPDSSTLAGGGSVDAFCEQIVAGANRPGDVLAIFGATLVVWVVSEEWIERPGLISFPSTEPGQVLVGGASNAGALFADWARSLLGGTRRRRPAVDEADERTGDPYRIPVWLPYLRGERTPFHDPMLRASIHGLDITQGPEAMLRAAHEASGFVIRRIVERSGASAKRIVATGGGSRSVPWMQAVADASGLPVETVAVPEGAALGAAFMARMVAGLETDFSVAGSWARTGGTIDPDPTWAQAAAARFARFEAIGPGT
ncbi:MAG: FGGY-family carbohydrate kinase [Acidimicrobiales bacterium]